MKVPLIRHLYQNNEPEKLQSALEVLETLAEARGITDEELNIIGECMTNICGAIEVHELTATGMRDSEAINAFAKKVMGSIDK